MTTLIFGHRGSKIDCPQNTIHSFTTALEAGADGLELDVHYSKDGEIVVFHDFELDALTRERGPVASKTLAELQTIEVIHPHGGCTIPSLEAVLQCIRDHEQKTHRTVWLNVEFKAGSVLYPGIEAKTAALCESYLSREQLIFSSFDHFALRTLKQVAPWARTGVLTMEAMVDPYLYVRHLQAEFYHPNVLTLFPEVLAQCHVEGVKLNPYTVNDLDQAKALIQAGLFGLITDRPADMLALRKSLEQEVDQ